MTTNVTIPSTWEELIEDFDDYIDTKIQLGLSPTSKSVQMLRVTRNLVYNQSNDSLVDLQDMLTCAQLFNNTAHGYEASDASRYNNISIFKRFLENRYDLNVSRMPFTAQGKYLPDYCASSIENDLHCEHPFCKNSFSNIVEAEIHHWLYHAPDTYRCRLCFTCMNGPTHHVLNYHKGIGNTLPDGKPTCIQIYDIKCIFCDEQFGTVQSITGHLKDVHLGVPKVQCTVEGCVTLMHPYWVSQHMKQVHSQVEEAKECHICKISLKNDKMYQRHLLSDTHYRLSSKDKAFHLDTVEELIKKAKLHSQQIKELDNDEPAICLHDGCVDVFENYAEMQYHYLEVHVNAFHCRTCNVNFRNWVTWKNHAKTTHSQTTFKCPVDGCTDEKEFTRNDRLLRHLKHVHVQPITTRCLLCTQDVNRRDFYRHVKSCAQKKALEQFPGRSRYEQMISKYLIQHGYTFKMDKKFDGLKSEKNESLSVDFYLPEQNVIIEYHGLQHYNPTNYSNSDTKLEICMKHDTLKEEYAANNKIEYYAIDGRKFKKEDDIVKLVRAFIE